MKAVRAVPTVTFDTRLPWARFLSGSAAARAKWLARATDPLPPRFRAVVPPLPEMPNVATMRPIRHWRTQFHTKKHAMTTTTTIRSPGALPTEQGKQ